VREPEYGYIRLLFADLEAGQIVEEWEIEFTPEDPSHNWYGTYKGDIIVCRSGSRIVYQRLNDPSWHFCDSTPDGWLDFGPIPNDFQEDLRAIREDWDAEMSFRRSVSPDGSVVVVVADVRGRLGRKYLREARLEVWGIDPAGNSFPRFRVPPLSIDRALPYETSNPPFAVSGGDPALLAVVADGRVMVWNTLTGELPAHLTLPGWASAERDREREDGVLFSDNGRRLVVHFGDNIFAWDTTDWSGIAFQVRSWVVAIAVSPSGDRVAIADVFGTVWFFDAATGTAREPITPIRPPMIERNSSSGCDDFGELEPVSLCYSPDGTTLLIGYADGTVAIWDVD
jgi:hypothetical protein